MMESLWSKTTDMPAYPPLRGELRADVAVIGGGMAGILIAYFLAKAGLHPVVLEAERIGSGQTKNTTAKITSQHGLLYARLVEQFGEELAQQYAHANQKALEHYRTLIAELDIDCAFTQCPAYLYSTLEEEPLVREAQAARRLGIEANFTRRTELPFSVRAAVRFDGQARFHPLHFLRVIASHLEIYEHTPVQSVEEHRLLTPHGVVMAETIVFACHYPFLNMPGYYFMRMHQERSYVLALENTAKMEGMYLGIDENGLSFRPDENVLLLGGGSHRTGENAAGGRYARLRRLAQRYWPESREIAAWSAQDCMTLDGVPYIGPFSSSTPHWYVATGFQKWGMTSSMVAAQFLTSQTMGRNHPDAEVFSPQRFKPSASAKMLIEETAHATAGLSRTFFNPPRAELDALSPGHGGIVEYDGKKAGVYKDEHGEIFVVSVQCPHLGCQLEWNSDEKSWDCPCHGSRFDYKGNLLDNPAQEDLPHA